MSSFGKTYIGGTAYDITKGKTLIAGTAYDIIRGKTLIGATAYDINAGSSIDFETIASDMTHLQSFGRDTNTADSISMESYYLPSTLQYMIGITNGHIALYKTQGTSNIVPLTTSMKNGAIAFVDTKYTSSGTIMLGLSSSGTENTSLYGGCLIFVDFPNLTNYIETIDLILSNATYTGVASRNSSSAAVLSTTNKSYQYYITCKYGANGTYGTNGMGNAGLTIWKCDGTNYTKIKQVGAAAGAVSGSSLTLGTCYGGSIIGVNIPSTLVPLTSLVNTSWRLDNYTNIPSNIIGNTYYINFVDNDGSSYTAMKFNYSNNYNYIGYGSENVYREGYGWYESWRKYISITGGTAATDSTLITWIQNNGTKSPFIDWTNW